MYKGINRIKILNPEKLLDSIDMETTDELVIRRNISAMYMSLFNFWAAIEYYQNNKFGNGKGSKFTKDDFTQICFERSITIKDNRYIYYLSNYRNACDHRLDNPAKVIIYKNGLKELISISIDNKSLRKACESFVNILKILKNEINDSV